MCGPCSSFKHFKNIIKNKYVLIPFICDQDFWLVRSVGLPKKVLNIWNIIYFNVLGIKISDKRHIFFMDDLANNFWNLIWNLRSGTCKYNEYTWTYISTVKWREKIRKCIPYTFHDLPLVYPTVLGEMRTFSFKCNPRH